MQSLLVNCLVLHVGQRSPDLQLVATGIEDNCILHVFTTQKCLSKSFRMQSIRKAFQELSGSFLLVQERASANFLPLFFLHIDRGGQP